jgi:hypothetical protein
VLQGPRPRTETLRDGEQAATRQARKRDESERRKQQRSLDSLRRRIAELESRIADREGEVKKLEHEMAAAGFYEDRVAAAAAIDRHQTLMWEVGDLIAQWEALQEHAREQALAAGSGPPPVLPLPNRNSTR